MKVIALDPGETTGAVMLELELGLPVGARVLGREIALDTTKLNISEAKSINTTSLSDAAQYFHLWFRDLEWDGSSGPPEAHKTAVVIEDYRVFASKANEHIGQRLHTAELIGVVSAVCALRGIPLYRVQPVKKGRWNDARLNARFPTVPSSYQAPAAWKSRHEAEIWATINDSPHIKAALQVGLVYLEEQTRWDPMTSITPEDHRALREGTWE